MPSLNEPSVHQVDRSARQLRSTLVSEKNVSALQRGLLVMETVNENGPIGLSSIQNKCGLPKATVLRMLETLCSLGYVQFDSVKKVYQVGARALALSNNFSFETHLLAVIEPVVERLRVKLGWPSDVAVFQHDKMVIVDTNRRPGMLSANRTIGSRVPIMPSATGRAYLAALQTHERDQIVSKLKQSDDPFEKTAKDSKYIERLVSETIGRGYAISNQEFLPGNIGAAVPILHDGKVVCVINFIALAKVSTLDKIQRESVPLLLQTKEEIEELLSR